MNTSASPGNGLGLLQLRGGDMPARKKTYSQYWVFSHVPVDKETTVTHLLHHSSNARQAQSAFAKACLTYAPGAIVELHHNGERVRVKIEKPI
jgi:hypothetical protein